MVPGVAVQIYAEERIAEMIRHKFIMVKDELWWDDMMVYQSLTQAADGRPTENVVNAFPPVLFGDEIVIERFKDIQYAWRANERDPLKSWPRRANPHGVLRTGRTMYTLPDTQKVLRFVPFEVGRQMVIRYRKSFDEFTPTSVVPMDEQLLILGAAYDYLEDDGANPGQTEKFLNMFNDRLRQLKSLENDAEIPLHPVIAPQTSGGYQVLP